MNNIKSLQKGNKFNYPLIDPPEWAKQYFKNNPNVSGMAIGGGMNGINGNRQVILNPYTNYNRDAVLKNERFRHYFDEYDFKLPNITKEQMNKYKGTPYEGDSLNIGRTEASRYLSGDNHLLTKDQIKYIKGLNIPQFKKGGVHIKANDNKKLIKRAAFAQNNKVQKHQTGSIIKKIGNFLLDSFVRFGNAQIAGDSGVGTSMAVASGYKHNPQTGMWEQSEENIKEAEGLRNNLAVLSLTFSPAVFSGLKFGIGNVGNFIKSPIGKNLLRESLKGMAWGTGSDIVSQAVTGKTLTNHIYDAADKGLQQVLPEKTYSWLSENVPNEVKHVGAGVLNPMYYGPNAFSSMVNGVYKGISNGFNQIGNGLAKNVPWIRNQFIANQINNNIANTKMFII